MESSFSHNRLPSSTEHFNPVVRRKGVSNLSEFVTYSKKKLPVLAKDRFLIKQPLSMPLSPQSNRKIDIAYIRIGSLPMSPKIKVRKLKDFQKANP